MRDTKGLKKGFDPQMTSKLKEALKRSVSNATDRILQLFSLRQTVVFNFHDFFIFRRHCLTVGLKCCGIFIINGS